MNHKVRIPSFYRRQRLSLLKAYNHNTLNERASPNTLSPSSKRGGALAISLTIVRRDWPSCKINLIHTFVTKILQHFFCFHSFCFLNSKNLLSHPRVKGFYTSRQHEVNRRSHVFNSPQDVVKAKYRFNSNP
jgi:hypothetical protein